MRVGITGATGFIGRRFVERLTADGHEVTALVRSTSKLDELQSSGARLVMGDVTDAASLQPLVAGCDVVYHLAGRIAARTYEDFLAVNERGVHNVVAECARQLTPPKVVVVSSLAAAGPVPARTTPRKETDPVSPVSYYGRSKLAGEIAARAFADQLHVTIARPCAVFGPGDRTVLVGYRMARRYWVVTIPTCRRLRCAMIHVDDLISGLQLAAHRGKPILAQDDGSAQGVYFLAHPEQVTYRKSARLMATAVGRRYAFVWGVPGVFCYGAAVLNEIRDHLTGKLGMINRDKIREGISGCWVCSIDRARDELGFHPTEPLQPQFQRVGDWYREQGWL